MKTNKHKISIITPSLNQGQFIEDAIMSVISQQGDFYIQHIIMDGGSTDNSIEVIKKYDQLLKTGKWPIKCLGIEFNWVSKKDKGQADALNKALDIVSGDIVCWLNTDDYYFPGTFGRIVRKFLSSPELDIIFGNCIEIDREGNEISRRNTEAFVKNQYKVSPFSYDKQWFIITPEAFVSKRCLANFSFDSGLQYAMDTDLWMYLFLSGFSYDKIKHNIAAFRVYSDAKSVKCWCNFFPILIIEEYIICRRYKDKILDINLVHNFIKLIKHFMHNWYRLGVLHKNSIRFINLLLYRNSMKKTEKLILLYCFQRAFIQSTKSILAKNFFNI